MKKYIIIGGVAGGATTAARLRRMDETAEIIMFEKGNYISYANCGLPYYIGGTIPERSSLFVQNPTTFGNRFDVEARVRTEVVAIDRAQKVVTCRNLQTGREYQEKYDKLVLSPGSVPVRPAIPGIELPGIFLLKDVADTDSVKDFLSQMPLGPEKKAIVVGAGFIGLEMAENLRQLGMEVSIVEKAPFVMPNADCEASAAVQEHLRAQNVRLFLNQSVVKFEKQQEQISVCLQNGQALPADFVLVSVGVRPNVALAKAAGLEIGALGGIATNEFMQTSDPDIYAVGDAVETLSPITGKPQLCYLAGPANKQARTCANNIVFGNHEKYVGAIGTAIAKVFDLTIGTTGLSESFLKKERIPYLTSITHTASNATYYPGNHPVTIKVNFAPETGRLLGASVVGRVGVDKRLDVLASVIAHQGTVFNLMDFDHAYAPPFSSAKDAVTVAGCVAENILTHKMRTIQWHELQEMLRNREENPFLLMDVRSLLEHRAGHIEGDENYPLEELREYLEDLPTGLPIVVYCAIGLRGYIACRILQQSGFEDVVNLAGGYQTYSEMAKESEN